MARRRSSDEVQRFDLAKYMVLIGLIIVFIIFFIMRGLSGYQEPEEVKLDLTPIPTYTVEATVVRPLLLSPASGTELTPGEVVLTGESAPEQLLQILINGAVVGQSQADADGRWRFSTELSEPGQQHVIVQSLDNGDTVSAETEPVLLSVSMPVVAVSPPSLDLTILDSALSSGDITLRGTG